MAFVNTNPPRWPVHHSMMEPSAAAYANQQPSQYRRNGSFRSDDIILELRQQPKECLVTLDGKEKARKPVDPPPIIQLKIEAEADPAQHFMQSPYLFMCASLYRADADEPCEERENKSLLGGLSSSLHRLKDTDNKDGAFFVFGDISAKVHGFYRLHFSLFELCKQTREVHYLKSITSEPFKILQQKDFKGMDESTYLSRAFSDQGVKLRLRKEPRATTLGKRTFPYENTGTSPAMSHEYGTRFAGMPSHKRFRPYPEDDISNHYPESSRAPGTTFMPHQLPAPQTLTEFNMHAKHSPYALRTTRSTQDIAFPPNMANTTSYYNNGMQPTSGASQGMAGAQHPSTEMSQQSLVPAYSSYGSQRGMNSPFPFPADPAGLSGYRPAANSGINEAQLSVAASGMSSTMPFLPHTQQYTEHRSGTASGMPTSRSWPTHTTTSYTDETRHLATAPGALQPMSLPQNTSSFVAQRQDSLQQPHDSNSNPFSDGSLSIPPELVHPAGVQNPNQLESQLPTSQHGPNGFLFPMRSPPDNESSPDRAAKDHWTANRR